MKVFRHVYRSDIVQPLVVALFLFQIGTGLFFVRRQTAAPNRTFQIASGVYLAFYVLGIPPRWARRLASNRCGAVETPLLWVLRDAWSSRQVPGY
jgi:hypothetical protein